MLRSLLVLCCLCGLARATDLHVPGDAPTITAAIALAQDGDTILVGPGTWAGGVDFLGKNISVLSTDGFAATTIDGGLSPWAASLGTASGSPQLSGFTIVGGVHGRVRLVAGAAGVSRCRILGADSAHGVGVSAVSSGAKLVADCRIAGNVDGGVRGSVFSGGALSVERCVVEDNGSANVDRGGGLFGAGVSARDCLIRGNTAVIGGGAAFLTSQKGCWFVGNTATLRAGAFYVEGTIPTVPVIVEDVVCIGNHAMQYGGAQIDTASFGESGAHTVRRSVFAWNTDDVASNVGLYSHVSNFTSGPLFTRLEQCTMLGNRIVADISGGGPLYVIGCIARSVVTPFTSAIVIVTHSDVEGGWPGGGNFDSDPRFVDAAHDVYALLPSSPCVNAGGPDLPLDPDGSPADVGALPLSPFVDAQQALFGSLGLPGLSGTGTLQPGSALTLSLVRARPEAFAALLVGIPPGLFAPFKGGVLVPAPSLVIAGLSVSATGQIILPATWPVGMPAGLRAWLQFWIADPAGPHGFAASNGLGLVAP